jgi:HTH-type transcriptional regulator/antitoxin HigA
MSTTLANPAKLIKMGAPHVIHSDEQLAQYTDALFHLTGKEDLTDEEEKAIELLSFLVERYESERHPIPEASPVDVLRFLLGQNGLQQRDIAGELGSESTVSLVLAGKRPLTLGHIEKLSARFHVPGAVFLRQGVGHSKTA